MTRRLSLDRSTGGIVVKCADCPHWYAFRFDRKAAWEAGRDHEQRAHPGSTQATTALSHYRDTPKRMRV